MKNQRVLLLWVLCIAFANLAYAQIQTPKHISITANSGGFYEYLPANYSTGNQTYPLIIFLHGLGELGNGSATDLPKLLNCWYALPRRIADGGFPSAFNVGGVQQGFIVLSPQFKAWPSAADVNAVLGYAIQNYRVNTNRIYITGLSMGGGATWDFAAAYPDKPAAIVPVCGASWPDLTKAKAIAGAKLPVWATHNESDPTVTSSYTKNWVSNISNNGGMARKTIFPVSGHDAWTKTYDPNYRENNMNVYEWMLQNEKTSAVSNKEPVANAGTGQTIELPTNTVTLNGSGNDTDGRIVSYSWNKQSGPATGSINSPSSASTAVTGLVQGSYVFRLTVTDDKGATGSNTVSVLVNAAPNQTPVANAGTDQTITLPINSLVLTGSGTDTDGNIVSYVWDKQSGPATGVISSPSAASTTLTGLTQGSYVFRLTVTDNQGASASDEVSVVVNAAVNQPPAVSAGDDQTITLPTNSVIVTGTATDPDGTIASYSWTKISGGAATIASPSASSTAVSGLTQGTYVFRLTVTDNNGATASDDVNVTVDAAANQAPTVNAGTDQTVTLPTNSVDIIGTASDPDGSITSYSWTKVSGGSATISSPSSASTIITGLVQGSYVFRLTATDNNGATASDEVNVTVKEMTPPSITANDLASYTPYNGKYSYGLNPGWYGFNWTTQQILDLGYGNSQTKGIGGKSFRMQIYDNYLSWYGDSSLLPDYEHLKALGATETAVMIGGPRDANKWDTAFYEGNDSKAKVFKGLYEPIFINGEVNPANTFAAYLYKVVKIYGQYIKFYEVWNEPDFTYGDGGWLGDTDPPHENSWFYRDPSPEDLVNLRTPIHYYIRMLRISWEVIKKYQPDAYVCTGGIGNRSFLDALLRNTDNPDGGKVTTEFPLQAGAYFDVLSFHTYPEFLLRNWATAGEPASADGFYYYRHSDSAIAKHLMIKNRMDALLRQKGYDGATYPIKQFICTETGMSRHTNIATGGYDFGGNEVQRNYMIKAHIKTQIDGQIKQTYWFSTADGDGTNGHWDQYGCYYYFGDKQPWNATPADQGIALKTTSDLLYGKVYDAVRTASLKLPSSIDGGAFKGPDGSYVYVLWAKTGTDLSETASAGFSFPEGLIASGHVSRKEWNFSQTGTTLVSADQDIKLNGSPAFFEEAAAPVTNSAPTANAGTDQTLTLPADSTVLNGSGTDTDGTVVSYQWKQVDGPSQGILASASQASTSVKGLIQGTYQFELEVADNLGATASDTVTVTVNPAVNKLPVASAGTDQTITLPVNSVNLNGAGTDPDGNITRYQWIKLNGPDAYTITTPSSASTQVTGLVQGVYVFRLAVTDNSGSTDNDDVQITVNAPLPPPNAAPTANAGKDITITLPLDKTQLTGSGTDPDGTIVSYQWFQIDGPAGCQITSPLKNKTSITGLTEGTYQFKLTVTDNAGAMGSDTVMVTVNPDKRKRSNASVYPNPATATINVTIDAVTDRNYSYVRIYNSLGNVVYQEEFLRTEKFFVKPIDISGFEKGVYFVTVNPDINSTQTMKFIKQ